MSLEYYLLCKKKYDEILMNLENIIYNYEFIKDLTNIEFDHVDVEQNIIFFIEIKKHMIELKTQLENKIIQICNHDFENDTIDIAPDRSKNITYCKICEYTK